MKVTSSTIALMELVKKNQKVTNLKVSITRDRGPMEFLNGRMRREKSTFTQDIFLRINFMVKVLLSLCRDSWRT